MIKLPKRTRPSSVVGLNVADGQLHVCLVGRAKGGIEVEKTVAAPLSIDLLHPDAELVGREIRNLLDGAGIRERQCVVALPPRWVMIHGSTLPELPPADAASLLQLEAEKGFPVDPAQLVIARSTQHTSAGAHVTQFAIRREQIAQLCAALKAAGLKPVSLSLGLPALAGAVPPSGPGRITVGVTESGVTLLVAAGGGIASFRTCDASIDSEAGEKLLNGLAVARELRITLEQVPSELRADVRALEVTGEPTLARQLAETLRGAPVTVGMTVGQTQAGEHGLGTELAVRLAARWLETGSPRLEFLPPHPSRWEQLLTRYSSKRLGSAGFAVAAAAVLVLLAFGWQQYRRWSLGSQWAAMQAQVTGLDAVQANIRLYRPFYDNSARSLTILKRVTECFPETGTVTAKTFEIHNNGMVTVSGTAHDNAALLATLDGLRKAREIQGLKIDQIRLPQFSFSFRWNGTPGT